MIPWIENINDLKAEIQNAIGDFKGTGNIAEYDLMLHAPIDGVISGLPDHGLTPEYLAALGFKRVFAGHYHHHKEFIGNVISIGALAHHTWSDVRSKAGFLIVYPDQIRWMKSHLPEFIDITPDMKESDAELIADGNYVRVKLNSAKVADIEKVREWLTTAGARGVIVQVVKAPVAVREGGVAATVSAGESLENSVSSFVKSQSFPNAVRIELECQKVLAEAGD